MVVEAHRERLKTFMNPDFPVERRKGVDYEPITL
jgi:hypothetical protein